MPTKFGKDDADLNAKKVGQYLRNEIKQLPKTKMGNDAKSETTHIYHHLTLLLNKNVDPGLRSEGVQKKHVMTIDTGAPTSLVGAKYFEALYSSYPDAISAQFKIEASHKNFIFGGGETTKSIGCCTFPIYIMDDRNCMQMIQIKMEIVEVDIIMLLGANGLSRTGAVLDLGNCILTLPKLLGTENKIAVDYEKGGHWTLDFYTLTKEEGYEAAQTYLVNTEWNERSAMSVLNYIRRNHKPKVGDIIHEVFLVKNKKGRKHDNKPLNQKDINKLHHLFGHAHPDKLEKLIKRSGRWQEKVKDMLLKLLSCEVCKVEGRRTPKPKVDFPKACRHNHVVAADLKENTLYPQSDPYILYLIDCFSRFKVAVFIPNKNKSTITEAICVHWVKLFGPMKYLHVDRGREWMNSELQSFCHKFDIRLTATAAMTPNANGICERQHAVCDRMMDKMITADPSLSPEIALCWAIHAANSLELNEGISPFTIVFGKTPMHPTLMDYRPGNEEEHPGTVSDSIRQYKSYVKVERSFCISRGGQSVKTGLKTKIVF